MLNRVNGSALCMTLLLLCQAVAGYNDFYVSYYTAAVRGSYVGFYDGLYLVKDDKMLQECIGQDFADNVNSSIRAFIKQGIDAFSVF